MVEDWIEKYFHFFKFSKCLLSDLRSLKMHYDSVPEDGFEIWSTGFANKQEVSVALTNRSLAFNLTCSRKVLDSNHV